MGALLLLLPAPTLGVLCGMVLFPGTALGAGLFSACKVWLVALPVVWHFAVQRQDTAPLRPAARGIAAGLGLGLLLGGVIVLLCGCSGASFLSAGAVRAKLHGIGFITPWRFAGLASYWIFVNSLTEEYAWRWFVTEQFKMLVRPKLAIVLSGVCFTLHHIVVLQALLPPVALGVSSAAVFVAGVLWSGCYVCYRSIWPGYASHAIADLAIFVVGYRLLFGG